MNIKNELLNRVFYHKLYSKLSEIELEKDYFIEFYPESSDEKSLRWFISVNSKYMGKLESHLIPTLLSDFLSKSSDKSNDLEYYKTKFIEYIEFNILNKYKPNVYLKVFSKLSKLVKDTGLYLNIISTDPTLSEYNDLEFNISRSFFLEKSKDFLNNYSVAIRAIRINSNSSISFAFYVSSLFDNNGIAFKKNGFTVICNTEDYFDYDYDTLHSSNFDLFVSGNHELNDLNDEILFKEKLIKACLTLEELKYNIR